MALKPDSGALAIPAGATTTQTGPDLVNTHGHRGISVTLDMTVVGTGSVTLTIQGKDRASGKYYTILVGAAVTTNVTNRYWAFPGATVTANVSANDELPEIFRLVVTANNANAATYTVGWSTLP
jgi:archaellum component FlaF (FlaF/FlaG flagellin family)